MNTSINMISPCLVLAVGSQAEKIVLDAQTLYLGGNPWRSSAARFISVRFLQTTGVLKAVCAPMKSVRAPKTSGVTRQQIYAATLLSSAELRAALESALHELRAHEYTVLAGLGEKRASGLHVLLLADLTRPESAAIFPLLAMLEDLLTHEAEKQVLLMLNVAQFSNGENGKDAGMKSACCHAGLQDLQTFINSDRNLFKEKLARDLRLAEFAFQPSFSIFLFDRYKEGSWEVKDENEVRILSANFLLALLTAGLAAQAEPLAWHSASATALFYDPQALIETCASRAALEFIQREFGEQGLPDLRMIQQVTDELVALYGDLRGWLQTMLSGTGFQARPGNAPSLETHFADLSFDDLPLEEWSLAIHGYGTHFGQAQFPADVEKLKANVRALAERLSQEQAETLDTLPRQGRLYPSGLATSRKVIANLRDLLRLRVGRFPACETETSAKDRLSQNVEVDTSSCGVEVDTSSCGVEVDTSSCGVDLALQLLDKAVSALPQPPRWFSLLPFSFGRLAKYIFALLYLRKEHDHLIMLRQQAVLALEVKYAALLEKEASQAISGLCQQLDTELDEMDQAVQAFQEEVQKVHARLENLGQQDPGLSIFRPSGVDTAVLDWARNEFRKTEEEIRYLLFDEHDFLYYWRDMDGRNLESGLMIFMRTMFQPLLTYNLDQILSQRTQDDLAALWTALSQGSLPLLRPDFDTCSANLAECAGYSGQTFQTQQFLCASPRNTVFAPFLNQPLAAWELLATGDPTLTMCVRVRHTIPVTALKFLMDRGQLDFKKLSGDDRDGMQLFATETEPSEES